MRALAPAESSRIRADFEAGYTLAACARAARVSPAILVRAAAGLPLRETHLAQVRRGLDSFSPLVSK